MCRPKNSKDKKSRKKRSEWTRHDTIFLKNNWDKMSMTELCKAMGKSKSCVRRNARDISSLRSKDFMSDVIRNFVDITRDEKISGVYGIVSPDNHKVYIGSSYDVLQRIRDHVSEIRLGVHYNSVLSKLDHSKLYFVLFSECEELLLMECEARFIRKYSPHVLLNKAIPQVLEEMKPFLDRAIERGLLDKYEEKTNECWEWSGRLNTSGYGKIVAYINGQQKEMMAHRVMYYHKTGEYPGLIRHMCHNRKCINPDHLQSGSARDNVLDTSQKLSEMFEKKYVEFRGNRAALTEYFGWVPNSSQVRYYIKKLNLKQKYPELISEKPKPRKKIKKPSAKKAKVAMFGRRGPKKKRYLNEVVDCWKCIEDYVDGKKHRWLCMECGRRWVSTRTNVKMSRGCKTCRTYPITEEKPYTPSAESYIIQNGDLV